jgi:hypothetical protein
MQASAAASTGARVTRAVFTAAVAAAVSACATPPAKSPLPTYRYEGIDLLTSTRGLLTRSGSCVFLGSGDQAIVPIWPEGTQMTADGIVLPAPNGSASLRFGRVAYLYGGHIQSLASFGDRSAAGMRAARACGASGFLVNRADTQESMERAAVRPFYTSGVLVRRDGCLVLGNAQDVLLPIWPSGTVVTEEAVVTPNLRGHAPLVIGRQAGMHGRYVHRDDGSLERAAGAEAARCAERGMIVEKANRVYLADSAAGLAAISDAVLVVELVGIASQPLEDAFLTTVTARIVEPLTGRFRAGETIKLRHAAGHDPKSGWQVSSHDPLFAPFGGTELKTGDRLLLFVNQDFYRQMAEARGGRPVAGYVGVGGGLYRIENGRIINHGSVRMPATIDELRRELQRR